MPTITKIKITTYNITNVYLDLMAFNESFRNIRKNYKYKGFKCFNCGKAFQDGEKISVAFTDKGNRTVCRGCGEVFMNELNLNTMKK